MSIDLSKHARIRALAPTEGGVEATRDERVGHVGAAGLPGAFLEDIGPSLCQCAPAGVRAHVAAHDRAVHDGAFGDRRRFEPRSEGRP
jgi:hypothetical protein